MFVRVLRSECLSQTLHLKNFAMVRQPTVYLTERPPLRTTRYGREEARRAG